MHTDDERPIEDHRHSGDDRPAVDDRPALAPGEVEPDDPATDAAIARERARIDRDDERAKRDDSGSRVEHVLFEEGPASPIAADIEEPEEHL